MILYAATVFSARSCSSSSSRSSPSRSCRGSAARRRCGPRASCSSSPCCCSATPMPTGPRDRSSRDSRRSCTSRCLREPPVAADHRGRGWKPAANEEPTRRPFSAAPAHDRSAVFPAFDDEAAGSGVVLAALSNAAPYRLFALSNFASLLALLGFPVLFEPASP